MIIVGVDVDCIMPTHHHADTIEAMHMDVNPLPTQSKDLPATKSKTTAPLPGSIDPHLNSSLAANSVCLTSSSPVL